jgi:hypothetical protein
MTQPTSTPSRTPAPFIASLTSLNPCQGSVDWALSYETLTEVWSNCPYGDWLLWLCFRQAPNLAERRRLAGCLEKMMSDYVTPHNMPTSESYAAALTTLSDLQSFADGKIDAPTLNKNAAPLELIKPVATTSAGFLEFELAQAIFDLTRSCANSDQAAGAEWASKCSTCLRHALLKLGLAEDFPSTQGVLATAIRTAVPFVDFTTLPPSS